MNFLIKWDLYPVNVVVSLGTSKKELLKFCKGNISDSDYQYIKKMNFELGETIYLDDGQVILWTKDYPKNNQDFSVLQHEIFHVVCFVMRTVGIKLSSNSEEAFAYLTGYYTKIIYEKLNIC